MADALFQISEPGESRPKHACRTRAVGIDLGTTNSLVAIVDAGKPTALADEGGGAIGPAGVRDRLALEFPRDTIASVKRFMGRGRHDAEATRKLTPYRFVEGGPGDGEGEGVVRFALAGG